MPFRCGICSDAYTINGTEHALCSTKCGHLFGKSCLERWIDENNVEDEFNCPVCREHVRCSDYHLIYDVPDEVLKITSNDIEDKCRSEDDVIRRCALGTLKEDHFFIEQDSKGKREFDGIYIDFFDAYNGYILIAGCHVPIRDNNKVYFLRIYEGDCICYNKDFKSADITAVALNKYSEDYFEFCVGLKNGVLHNTVFTLSNGINGTPHESILFNENERINSICYLRHNDIVYSVGNCGIYNIHIECSHSKKNWFEKVAVKLETITNLKVINDSTLLGIMDNKIYVFGKNIIPYEIYSDEDLKFSTFEYDSVSKMILINAMKLENTSHSNGNLNAVLLGIKKDHTYETYGCTRGQYTNYNIKKLDYHDFRIFENSFPIFTKRCGRNFTYTFIPDMENGTLRAYAIDNGFVELVNDEAITCLDTSTYIVALDKPQFFTSKMLKIPFAVVYEDYFTIYNFYTSIERVVSEQL